jgi:hypothetical protein
MGQWLTETITAVILGKQWANETSEVRSKYKKMADDMKRKLHEKHPDYRYAPRRSSEIIRRVCILISSSYSCSETNDAHLAEDQP